MVVRFRYFAAHSNDAFNPPLNTVHMWTGGVVLWSTLVWSLSGCTSLNTSALLSDPSGLLGRTRRPPNHLPRPHVDLQDQIPGCAAHHQRTSLRHIRVSPHRVFYFAVSANGANLRILPEINARVPRPAVACVQVPCDPVHRGPLQRGPAEEHGHAL